MFLGVKGIGSFHISNVFLSERGSMSYGISCLVTTETDDGPDIDKG